MQNERSARVPLMIAIGILCVLLVAGLVWILLSREETLPDNMTQEQQAVVAEFTKAIVQPERPLWPVDLMKKFDAETGLRVLSVLAKGNPNVTFDGKSRFCQMHPKGYDGASSFVVNPKNPEEYSQALHVALVNSRNATTWYGPYGMRIKRVSFTKTGLAIAVYGAFKLDGQSRTIEEGAPLEVEVPWAPETEPAPCYLGELLGQAR